MSLYDQVMSWRLLLEECGPKILHIVSITNTVTNATSKLDMDPICKVSEKILKGLKENEYIHGEHMHLTRALSYSSKDNSNLSICIGEYFANVSKAVKDVTSPTKAYMAHDQRADVTLQQFHNGSIERYCVIIIGNAELLVFNVILLFLESYKGGS